MKKEKRPSPTHSRAELAYPSPFPAEGGRKERKKNWKEYTATVEDIQNFLMDRVLLRHNVITGRVECRIPERDSFSWMVDSGWWMENTSSTDSAADSADKSNLYPPSTKPLNLAAGDRPHRELAVGGDVGG